MKTGNFRKFLFLSVLIAIITTMGCSATRDVYEVGSLAVDSVSDMILPDPKPLLKKKILVAPVINQADISSSLADEIKNECISYLSENDYLYVNSLNKWDDEDSDSLLKRYGVIMNPAHLKTAEKMGVNILFAVIVHPIEVTEIRSGIWPFRKDKYNILISVSINALDTMNGTLIVSEDITKNIEGGEVVPSENKKWKPGNELLRDEITSYVKKLCSRVIKDLEEKSWQSKLYTEGSSFVLKAGRDIGISESTVFELFKKGEPVMSYSGDKYYVFGDKIGEARVKSVSQDKAVLTVSADGEFKDAAYVSVKRDDD